MLVQFSLAKVKEFIFDLLFPKKCVSCQREGDFFCHKCQQKINFIQTQSCPFCNRISPLGRFCERCQRKYKMALSGILVAAHLEDPLREAIHTYKYQFVKELSYSLSQILISTLRKNLPHKAPILIPTPLHRRRKAWRGFNQAELLADLVGCEFGLPVLKRSLLRIKNTYPQIELKRQERKENVKGAFFYQGKDLKKETILLIDDVATTGATLNECAKELKKAGARAIWGVVLGRD